MAKIKIIMIELLNRNYGYRVLKFLQRLGYRIRFDRRCAEGNLYFVDSKYLNR